MGLQAGRYPNYYPKVREQSRLLVSIAACESSLKPR